MMRFVLFGIVGLIFSVCAASAQAEQYPFYENKCPFAEGFWVSFPRENSDERTIISFPDQSITYGRLRVDRVVNGRRQWELETDYQCSNGVGFCFINFRETGKESPYIFDQVEVGNKTVLHIDNIQYDTVRHCYNGLCGESQKSYMGKKLVTSNANEVNHVIPGTYYLYDCKDNPRWEFDDVAEDVKGRDSGEISYELGSCVIKSKGIHFGFRPFKDNNRNAQNFPSGDVIVYSDQIAGSGTYFTIYIDGNLFENLNVSSDNGYLGEYHYTKGSMELFQNIASGNTLEIRKDRDTKASISLKGSALPVREFLKCVDRYR